MNGVLEKLPESRSYLIVMPEKDDVDRARGRQPAERHGRSCASYLNVRDVLKYERLVVIAGSDRA